MLLVAPAAYAGGVFIQCPPDEDGVDTDGDTIDDNDNVCIHVTAGDGFVNMADGRLQYMFGFADVTGLPEDEVLMAGMLAANLPSPTIKVKQGQKLYLNMTNVGMFIRPDLFDPHTIHFHGFPQAAPIFDGVPDNSVSIIMGASITYFYNLVHPGTFIYHCHVEATEHIQMGMYGNLYVTPIQDGTLYEYPPSSGRTYTKFAYNDGDGSTGYDVDFPIQISDFDYLFHDASLTIQPLPFALMGAHYPLINGRGYPDTVNEAELPNSYDGKTSQKIHSNITAVQGQRILLRVSNLSVTDLHTIAVQGMPMLVVGRGSRQLRNLQTGENLHYKTNSLSIGGGQTFEVILDTKDVPPGTYMLYSSNLQDLNNYQEDFGGLMTEITIYGAGAKSPKGKSGGAKSIKAKPSLQGAAQWKK
jgi:FtsP/CotA-like multicopper oxidase with cupredoxin domain